MSRLRRLLTTHRVFFVTAHFTRQVLPITREERSLILRCLAKTRERRRFLMMAYVVMPTHIHLLFAPHNDDAVSVVMREIKLRAAKQIQEGRAGCGSLWQARFFDRIVRHPKEWRETIEYIHGNPVKDRLVEKAGEWPWSSWGAYQPGGAAPVPVDFVEMPLDDYTPLAW